MSVYDAESLRAQGERLVELQAIQEQWEDALERELEHDLYPTSEEVTGADVHD